MSVATGEDAVGVAPRVLLAAGDVALVGAFVVAGEFSHGVNPFARVGRTVDTALPFLIGWALAATVAGLYGTAARAGPAEAAGRTAAAWVAAAVVGLGLRATPLFHGGFAVPFLLVSVGVGLALLVPWRAAAAYGWNRRAAG